VTTQEVHVLYFAVARERVGLREERISWPSPAPVHVLLERLVRTHPALAPVVPHLRVSVNQEFATPDALVHPGAEVALIPPVSGGSGLFRVVDRPVFLSEVVEAVATSRSGGVVTFTGNVRSETGGRRVLRLEYEAYPAMAERKLAEIGAGVQSRWPGTDVAILHRVGVLVPGDAAVVIATAAPHRAEAFRACEHVISELKKHVPIWKKEIFEDGGVWVGMGP
jgi:MoaE-MoaD fusion protein